MVHGSYGDGHWRAAGISGIEHSANGWEMLGWAAAALVLLAAALAMLGLGCCADKESRKGNKAHKAPADTVKPKSRRKAG